MAKGFASRLCYAVVDVVFTCRRRAFAIEQAMIGPSCGLDCVRLPPLGLEILYFFATTNQPPDFIAQWES